MSFTYNGKTMNSKPLNNKSMKWMINDLYCMNMMWRYFIDDDQEDINQDLDDDEDFKNLQELGNKEHLKNVIGLTFDTMSKYKDIIISQTEDLVKRGCDNPECDDCKTVSKDEYNKLKTEFNIFLELISTTDSLEKFACMKDLASKRLS